MQAVRGENPRQRPDQFVVKLSWVVVGPIQTNFRDHQPRIGAQVQDGQRIQSVR